MLRVLAILFLASFFVLGCVQPTGGREAAPQPAAAQQAIQPTAAPYSLEQQLGDEVVAENGVRKLKGIDLSKIVSGGPAKDGIPSIDAPKFVPAEEASEWLEEKHLVLGLDYKGVQRAYPLLILVWHEIVNDVVAGDAILITYCPLCLTGIAFNRSIDGQAVEFGTSGKLYNSNLVMYDRETDSLWSQALGQAIAGPLAGRLLELVPIETTTWGAWKTKYPETQVLSPDTGKQRPYGTDPYGDYYTTTGTYFPVEHASDSLAEKAWVAGLVSGSEAKAYPVDEVRKARVANDEFAGKPVLAVWDEQLGAVKIFSRELNAVTYEFELREGKIFDRQTGSRWSADGLAIAGRLEGSRLQRVPGFFGFWFSWYSFHPGTKIFRAA